MKNIFQIGFLIILLISGSCSQDKNHDQTRISKKQARFSIHGANALYPLAQIWADEYMSVHPEVRITVFPASSSKGKTDVILGLAEIGMYSGSTANDTSHRYITIKVAKDAVVPTMNAKNPELTSLSVTGISPQKLADVFVTGKIGQWGQLTGSGNTSLIKIFTRSDVSGAASVWAGFLNTTQENLKGTGVYGDAGMTQAIKADIYSLGFDNLRYVYDNTSGQLYPGMAVPPIDLNSDGRLDSLERNVHDLESLKAGISSGHYAPALCRDLHFLLDHETNNPHVLDFLNWVLNEGQQIVDEAGYVPVSKDEILLERVRLESMINKMN